MERWIDGWMDVSCVHIHMCTTCMYLYVWLGCQVDREPDLWQTGCGFESRLARCRVQPWESCSSTCASVTKQYNLVPANGRWCSVTGKVTTDLAESNGSLPPALITCGLTAEDRDQLRNPTLVSNMGLHFCVFIYVLFLVFSHYAVTSSTVVSDADSSLILQGKHHLYSAVYCCILLCNFHLDVDLYKLWW